MADNKTRDAAASRYGPVALIAGTANMLVLQLVTWIPMSMLPLAAVFAIPVLAVDLGVSVLIARASGTLGQAGRGMLFGALSVPLTLAIVSLWLLIPLWLGLA